MDWTTQLQQLSRLAPELITHLGVGSLRFLRGPPALIELARLHAASTLVRAPDGALTGAELVSRALPLAIALRSRGLRPGIRAITALGSCTEQWIVAAAVGAAGGTWLPVGAGLAPEVLHRLVERSGARFVFSGDSTPAAPVVAAASPGVQDWIGIDDTPGFVPLELLQDEGRALLAAGTGLCPSLVIECRTRGTRGAPRIVPSVGPAGLPALLGVLRILTPTAADRLHLGVPLYRPSALAIAMVFLWVGATIDTGEGQQATVAIRSADALGRLVDFGASRAMIAVGGPVPPEARAAWAARGGAPLHLAYGSAETGLCAWLRPADAAADPRATGLALPGIELAVRDEIVYARRMPAGSWLTAGDRGRLEGERLVITGRGDR
ncbi:MAG TPA: hypothetical protein ENK18_16680 [Deltaproteobacteria bacterium]|nr:hypothetical protein [Deltaproteobacteria bacterium]